MKSFLIRWLLLFGIGVASCPAADRITATMTCTNATTNGMTLVVNLDTRLWTNNVTDPTSEVLTNNTAAGACTNLYAALLSYPVSAVTVYQTASNVLRFDGRTGDALSVSGSGDWYTVAYSTQAMTTAERVLVPYTAIPSGTRPVIAAGLVEWLNQSQSNALYESANSVSNLVGRTNAQTISGAKTFTGATVLSNAASVAWSLKLANPSSTNGANYGNAFLSPGSGTDSDQFGSGAQATNTSTFAAGHSAIAGGLRSTAAGYQAQAIGTESLAVGANAYAPSNSAIAVQGSSQGVGSISIGGEVFGSYSVGVGLAHEITGNYAVAIGESSAANYSNSVAIGYSAATTAANQIMLGTDAEAVIVPGTLQTIGSTVSAQFSGTNNFPAGADIAFGRYANTSLANGNNYAVEIGTNVFVQVSGPTGAFAIYGINGQPNRDGKLVILLNLTGQDMTIAHDSGDPTDSNRIYSLTGSDRATTGNGAAMLIYSANASRWILLSLDP